MELTFKTVDNSYITEQFSQSNDIKISEKYVNWSKIFNKNPNITKYQIKMLLENYCGKRIVNFDKIKKQDVMDGLVFAKKISNIKHANYDNDMQIDIVSKGNKSTKTDYMQVDIVLNIAINTSKKQDYMVIEDDYNRDIKIFKNKMARNNIDIDVINNFINDYNSKYLAVKKLGGIYNLKLWSDSILS
jgi:hypothetical protein